MKRVFLGFFFNLMVTKFGERMASTAKNGEEMKEDCMFLHGQRKPRRDESCQRFPDLF